MHSELIVWRTGDDLNEFDKMKHIFSNTSATTVGHFQI
jgi:hypothetical protein